MKSLSIGNRVPLCVIQYSVCTLQFEHKNQDGSLLDLSSGLVEIFIKQTLSFPDSTASAVYSTHDGTAKLSGTSNHISTATIPFNQQGIYYKVLVTFPTLQFTSYWGQLTVECVGGADKGVPTGNVIISIPLNATIDTKTTIITQTGQPVTDETQTENFELE